ncbi:MAG: hypothetical protein ACK4UJ_06190 [Leptonema sp. (in: bacteria)]
MNSHPEIETKKETMETTTSSKKEEQAQDPSKDNQNISHIPSIEQEEKKEMDSTIEEVKENHQFENTISDEVYKKIAYYKNQSKQKEDQYWLDYKNFQIEKNKIITYKTNQKNSEISYESYKREYWIKLENEKRIKEEQLNQKDPERKMFWRMDFNQEFPEQIHFKIQSGDLIYLCEIQNPILYILKPKFRCNSKSTQIDSKLLENSNFFETISLFYFLPERKSYFFIYMERNQKQTPLVIYNKNREPYKIAFIETDGKVLFKIYVYTEKIIKDKKKYFFKIVSPLDFLFGLSE